MRGGVVEVLAAMVGACQSLNFVDLSDNWLGTEGAIRVAEVVVQCGSGVYVDLRCNKVGVQGVQMLEAALQKCPHVDVDV
jgi:Ran GTPase-activating protein (RanGAP) involved in mRNA processing and transport